jgi:1-acyl-sn-glycerol-3-phosphate acyltransferase
MRFRTIRSRWRTPLPEPVPPAARILTLATLARNLVALVWSLLAFLAVGIAGAVSLRTLSVPLASRFPRFWGRSVLWILGIEVDVRGEEHLADARAGRIGERWPCVIVTNHQSVLDLPLMALLGPRAPLVMGKAELRWMPGFNLMWWGLGQAFVPRGDARRSHALVDAFVTAMRAAPRTVMLAPEGTRTPDGRVLPFKRGAFRIAAAAGVPILPVVLEGAFGLVPKGQLWIPPGRVRVTVHPPIPTAGWRPEDAGVHADTLHARYRAWLGEAEQLDAG